MCMFICTHRIEGQKIKRVYCVRCVSFSKTLWYSHTHTTIEWAWSLVTTALSGWGWLVWDCVGVGYAYDMPYYPSGTQVSITLPFIHTSPLVKSCRLLLLFHLPPWSSLAVCWMLRWLLNTLSRWCHCVPFFSLIPVFTLPSPYLSSLAVYHSTYQ